MLQKRRFFSYRKISLTMTAIRLQVKRDASSMEFPNVINSPAVRPICVKPVNHISLMTSHRPSSSVTSSVNNGGSVGYLRNSDVNKDFSPRTRTRTWVPRTGTRTRTWANVVTSVWTFQAFKLMQKTWETDNYGRRQVSNISHVSVFGSRFRRKRLCKCHEKILRTRTQPRTFPQGPGPGPECQGPPQGQGPELQGSGPGPKL